MKREAMNCRMLVRKWAGLPLWWATLLPPERLPYRPRIGDFCADCPPDKSKRVAARTGREWARKLGMEIRKVVFE